MNAPCEPCAVHHMKGPRPWVNLLVWLTCLQEIFWSGLRAGLETTAGKPIGLACVLAMERSVEKSEPAHHHALSTRDACKRGGEVVRSRTHS